MTTSRYPVTPEMGISYPPICVLLQVYLTYEVLCEVGRGIISGLQPRGSLFNQAGSVSCRGKGSPGKVRVWLVGLEKHGKTLSVGVGASFPALTSPFYDPKSLLNTFWRFLTQWRCLSLIRRTHRVGRTRDSYFRATASSIGNRPSYFRASEPKQLKLGYSELVL